MKHKNVNRNIKQFVKTSSGMNRLAFIIALGIAFYFLCSGMVSSLKLNYYLSPYLSTSAMIEGFFCDALLLPILALVFWFIVIRISLAVGKYGLRISLNLVRWVYNGFKHPPSKKKLKLNPSNK